MLQQKEKFIQKYGKSHQFPEFKWQKSFHDHLIRDERDLLNHLNYIEIQWLKHELGENKWCFTERMHEKALETTKALLKENMPIKKISENNGLSVEEIERLKN